MSPSFDQLAVRFSTDKARWGHNFTEFYSDLFDKLRGLPLRLIEFGVKFGSSLRMWEEAFPKAEIIGVDNNWRIRGSVMPKRAKLVTADLTNRSEIENLCEEHGPFDIVVDDSAHTSEVTRNLVETLWPRWINHGGWLVIEDINSGYKTDPETGLPFPQHDQIDYCMGLVRNVCHSGKLARCGPDHWRWSSEFDKAIRQIVYRPGIMAMERR